MSNPNNHLGKSFLFTAKRLASSRTQRPKQGDLRRAVSSAYYAVFHTLARHCADALVGASAQKRSNKAWIEAYRGLEHGNCKNACVRAKKIDFPAEIQNIASAIVTLQEARHEADYDPTRSFRKEEVQNYIALAETCITAMPRVKMLDRRAFATWVLIHTQGAKKARQE